MQHISRGACRGRHHASAQRGRARSVRNGEGEGGEGQATAAAIVVWNALWWFEEITQPNVKAGADTVPLYYQTYNCATPGYLITHGPPSCGPRASLVRT